jgi:hypothetical protein
MLKLWRGIALVAALMFNGASALAQADRIPANEVMPSCRSIALKDFATSAVFVSESCAAMLGRYFNNSSGNGNDNSRGICPPREFNIIQMTRVVVQYIDRRPARMHEDFDALALEALRAAWPCKN